MKKDDIFEMVRRCGNIAYEQGNAITKSLDNLGQEQATANKLKEQEMLQRDRVDIALKDYEEMKALIKTQREQLEKYDTIWKAFNIDEFIPHIDTSSIKGTVCDDYPRCIKTIHITFDTIPTFMERRYDIPSFSKDVYNNSNSNKRRF